MFYGILISIGILGLLVVTLQIMRGKEVAKKPLPLRHVIVVLVLVIAAAAGIDYYVATHESSPVGIPSAGAGGPGMGMMGGPGGMGGPQEPSPRRDLSRYVRKMALILDKQPTFFTTAEAEALVPLLTGLQGIEKLTEDEAPAKLQAIQEALTEDQRKAVDAIELPRPNWGGMGGGGPGAGPSAGPGRSGPGSPGSPGSPGGPGALSRGGPGGSGGPGGGRPDRMQMMRERAMAVPFVKQQYDVKVAEDATFATDQTKQQQFFRTVMREVNPFLQPQAKEPLAKLIQALQGGGAPAATPAVPVTSEVETPARPAE